MNTMRMVNNEITTNSVYYAIGDIHGEAEKLTRLHSRIRRKHRVDFPGQTLKFVHLGDFIDRGPDSCNVVDKLIKLERDHEPNTINLKGNHEAMMLDAYQKRASDSYPHDSKAYDFWLRNGGDKTIESYVKAGLREPPLNHLAWMSRLNSYYWDRAANLIFVHAGIDPVHFPNDGENRHLWTRSQKFFETKTWPKDRLKGITVIHGHTPTKSGLPDIDGDFRRINIDTGACYGGYLTAVVLAPNEPPRFISV